MVSTPATAQLQRRLRRFITFDQVVSVTAGAAILSVHTWLHPSGYLLLLAALIALTGGVMGLGRRPLAAGNLRAAIMWVAAANWGVSLVATAVATFCLPITIIAAMLPSVLAVPYVDARSLSRINAVSMAVSTLVVLVGTTQDFSGLTGRLPPWLPAAVLVAFVPFIAGLVVMVNAHNSARLTRTLSEALDANRQLRVSEGALRESRARLVAATDGERRRIARDLHDGSQQRLISVALGVQRARRLVGSDPATAEVLLEQLSGELRESMSELRNLAHGVYPVVLTDRGLREALSELAARVPCHCSAELGRLHRCVPEIEASVYWCCVEALHNVAKHAGAGACARLRVVPGQARTLIFVVEDDGAGFDPGTVRRGQGLANMADRIGAVGGELVVSSAPGRGVRVHGVVPAVEQQRHRDGTGSAPDAGTLQSTRDVPDLRKVPDLRSGRRPLSLTGTTPW